jgi:hypothetical protein
MTERAFRQAIGQGGGSLRAGRGVLRTGACPVARPAAVSAPQCPKIRPATAFTPDLVFSAMIAAVAAGESFHAA